MRASPLTPLAGLQLDHRLHRLAPLLVGHADHGAVLHRRVAPDHPLDLDGEDVEPARDDHVLLAVHDVDEAVVVLVADVAGVVPAMGADRRAALRVVEIAEGDEGAAHHDLAPFAGGQQIAVVVHHLDLDEDRRAAAAQQPMTLGGVGEGLQMIGRREDADGAGALRLSVDLGHAGAEEVDGLGHLVGRHRRAAIDEVVEGGKVELAGAGVASIM